MLIGEVSARSGISTRMLRHYDRLGLVCPTGRTSGGYREYSLDDVRRLFHVESLRTLGLSLQEVKDALGEPGFEPGALVTQLIIQTRARMVAEQQLLERLERVRHAAPSDWAEVLRLVTQVRALESDSGDRRMQAVLTPAEVPISLGELTKAVLSEDDPNVAGALRWALARSGESGLARLSDGMRSDDVAVRRRAVSAIAAIGGAQAAGMLRTALDDPDQTVADRAALALAADADASSLARLVAMVVDGRRDVEAAEALGRLSGQENSTVTALHGHLAAASVASRLRITQALAEIPGRAADDLLAHLLADPDRTIAATAQVIADRRGGV
ncbi:MerR family transcriptional regulator [Gordonia sp. CPCC 206044]|uniref:MerR family transcriptional regulator n=1 Tax=Gordonia sp. CPCC 206044 TaxID=3140793 RepID=UPI003AF38C23